MVDKVRFSAFTGELMGPKIVITNPPLALVLVQIAWPSHGKLDRDFEALSADFDTHLDGFPLRVPVKGKNLQLTPEGVVEVDGDVSFQWRSADDVWGINLTKRTLSLFCTRHDSYDFSEVQQHLDSITRLIGDVLQVKKLEKIAVRYVNRATDPRFIENLNNIFLDSVLGYLPLKDFAGSATLASTFNQATYEIEGALLNVRSGLLMPGDTPDPALAPLEAKSWVLDLDASLFTNAPYSAASTFEDVNRLSEHLYDFFRLVLKDNAEVHLSGAQ